MIALLALAAAVQSPPPRPKAQPPKIEWIHANEVPIRDPHGFDPETKYNRPDYSDPKVFEKDTFVWA